jgi:hypothetical protein
MVLPLLIDAVSNCCSVTSTRAMAARAIGNMGSSAADAVPSLARILEVRGQRVISTGLLEMAIWSLGEIGRGASLALPGLRVLASGEHWFLGELSDDRTRSKLRNSAVGAIGRITSKTP